MKAEKSKVLHDILGKADVVYKIPVYQRNYDWTARDCNRLLDDIEDIMNRKRVHFLGSIVLLEESNAGFQIRNFVVIDGQQRITTMTILLKALADSYPDKSESILNRYIKNYYSENESDKIKLHPLNEDAHRLMMMLNNKCSELEKECSILINYDACLKRINRWKELGVTYQGVYDALTLLEMVTITLSVGEDDPQAIFECINSTGKPLSKADLIRNYLMMRADNQQILYNDFWLPFEKKFSLVKRDEEMDQFFYLYMMYKTGNLCNKSRLYESFASFYGEEKQTYLKPEYILQELDKCAEIYNIIQGKTNGASNRLNDDLTSLRQLDQATCYPFIFKVYSDYQQNNISLNTLEKVIRLLLSYLVHRAVCGIPSNSLRALFCSLYDKVFKIEKNKELYYESINKFLYTRTSRDRFPSSSEFKEALLSLNLYSNLKLCRYLLSLVENGESKEKVQLEKMSIEHIMPQHLNKDWQHIDESEHAILLHVIGNLTFTGYNSELSDRSFEEKKEILKHSKVIELNRDIVNQKQWSKTEIKLRSIRLTEIIQKHLNEPEINNSEVQFENVVEITVDTPWRATSSKIQYFKINDSEIPCYYYSEMLETMAEILQKHFSERLQLRLPLARRGSAYEIMVRIGEWLDLCGLDHSIFRVGIKEK